MTKDRVEFANTLRGMAALFVLISHYFCMFWLVPGGSEDMINVPTMGFTVPSGLIGTLDFFAKLGPLGVALFFLISGFVIPFSLAKGGAVDFMVRRIVRLYPTYIVGFSISLLVIYTCGAISGRVFPHPAYNVITHYFPGLRDIFNTPTIDGIIWTLDIEMKFYVVCALVSVFFRSKSLFVFVAPVALFVATMGLWLLVSFNAARFTQNTLYIYQLVQTAAISSQFICFMFIGTAFHYLHRGTITSKTAAVLALGFYGLFMIEIFNGPDEGGQTLAPIYTVALIVFALSYVFRRHMPEHMALRFLAKISYPLYVVHGVLGYALLYYMTRYDVPPYVSVPLTTAAAVCVAYALHVYVEAPSQKIASAPIMQPAVR